MRKSSAGCGRFTLILTLMAVFLTAACGPDTPPPTVHGRWEVIEFKPEKPLPKSAPKLRFMTFQADGVLVMERVRPGGKPDKLNMEYEIHHQDGQTLLRIPRMQMKDLKVNLHLSDDGKGLKIVFSGRNKDEYTLKRVEK